MPMSDPAGPPFQSWTCALTPPCALCAAPTSLSDALWLRRRPPARRQAESGNVAIAVAIVRLPPGDCAATPMAIALTLGSQHMRMQTRTALGVPLSRRQQQYEDSAPGGREVSAKCASGRGLLSAEVHMTSSGFSVRAAVGLTPRRRPETGTSASIPSVSEVTAEIGLLARSGSLSLIGQITSAILAFAFALAVGHLFHAVATGAFFIAVALFTVCGFIATLGADFRFDAIAPTSDRARAEPGRLQGPDHRRHPSRVGLGGDGHPPLELCAATGSRRHERASSWDRPHGRDPDVHDLPPPSGAVPPVGHTHGGAGGGSAWP